MPDSSSSSSPDIPENSDTSHGEELSHTPVTPDNSLQPHTPRHFTLRINREEFNRVVDMAEKMAGEGNGQYTFALQCETATTRRWVFRAPGCVRWLFEQTDHDHFEDEDIPLKDEQPERGLITLNYAFVAAVLHQLPAMQYTDNHDKPVEFTCDLDANTITYTNGDVNAVFTLPFQRKDSFLPRSQDGSFISINEGALESVSPFLSVNPAHSDEEFMDIMGGDPFITGVLHNGRLVFTRDWSRLGGPVVTCDVYARGTHIAPFSMKADFLIEGFSVPLFHGSGSMKFWFSEDEPGFCEVVDRKGTYGFRFPIQPEHVALHRSMLEVALSMSEYSVCIQHDAHSSSSPVISAVVEGRDITITILPGTNLVEASVRVSTVISSDIPWSDQLGSEINAWNDAWSMVKLVHTDDSLSAVTDLSHSGFSNISEVVHDLVTKAGVVEGVIAAVL